MSMPSSDQSGFNLTGPDLTGPARTPADGRPARQLVVLLHGLGADGHDLIDLADAWAPLLPRAAFLSPHAPFPCDMAPYGRQWFSLRDWTMASLTAGVQAAAPVLQGFLDRERRALGLSWSQIALVGFSQGTMLALHLAPRLPEPLGAVVGFSGALAGPELLPMQIRSRPPVLLLHGEADGVVPAAASMLAAQALEQDGIPVTLHVQPGLDHALDEDGIARAGQFLARHLR